MHDMYDNDITDVEDGLVDKRDNDEIPVMYTVLDRKVPTPEVNDYYVNSSVMFPRGNIYARGKVVGRNVDANSNSVGGMNDNPILGTRKYCVQFDYGDVIELTSHVISYSMYAACDDYGNENLMMEPIVD